MPTDYRPVPEATTADLTDADNRALAEALEPSPCPEGDSAPEYLPCRPGLVCFECGELAVLVDYAHAYACSEACLAAFWASVRGGEE